MSSVPPSRASDAERQLHAARSRVDALERAQHERIARANEALAAAQDRAYWLDRWNLDLNALMRRRGAAELRAAFRVLRTVYRAGTDARRGLGESLGKVPVRLEAGRKKLADERAHGPDRPTEPFARILSPSHLHADPVSERLFARLSVEDAEAVRAALQAGEDTILETADEPTRRRLTLAFAAHHRVQPALEHSGLSAEMPPEDVHAMARGPLAAGGDYYTADLVVDSLARSGFELQPGQSGLDFGCSSGRVVRVLATAYPELDWYGCDPIPGSVEWARGHLPEIAFEHSPEYPPLPYQEAGFDFVFAISIWSHFAEGAALDWLSEMHRVIRPGGRLLLTTHGEQTISFTHQHGQRSFEQLTEVGRTLFERGFWYSPEFGQAGDHGVANPDWGTAFLSAEWLLARATPNWGVSFFSPGRLASNQDVYVLERR